MQYCYFNGTIIPEKDAVLPVRDIGVLRGYSIFDVMRTYDKAPLLLHEHFARLERSAATLGFRVPFSEKKFASIVRELSDKNACGNAAVRTVITGGPTADGMQFRQKTQSVFIIISPLHPLPKEVYERGVVLETIEHHREFPYAKTANYITAVRWHNTPRIKPVFDALYTWEGKALEATTSNFFIVKKGTFITPKKSVLHGITRNTVIALAKKTGKVIERDISIREMRSADEAFLTATNKDVVPVVLIDGRKIGSGKPGKRTKEIMEAYAEHVKRLI